jgi:hypothetical protein
MQTRRSLRRMQMVLDRPDAQDPYAKLPQVGSFNLVFHTVARAQLVATFQR